jgi:hypothetical protein
MAQFALVDRGAAPVQTPTTSADRPTEADSRGLPDTTCRV